jgi:A/G-specific adenine glycosylase
VSLELPQISKFRRQLLAWYARTKRDLPWRRSRDPYSVWVSEVMLQQTRVTAAVPYYERFLHRFPDFYRLAESLESDLLAHWAGLGYYYRARNMQKAARKMAEDGAFPSTYDAIRDLPGVGDYTAAAIASISFNLPHAVVDGNVLRVLSRVDDDATDIATALGKKRFTVLAETLLDRHHSGEYNQALMELGATVCLPKNPQCLICPVCSLCLGRARGRQNDLPVKARPQKSVEEQRTLYWIEQDDRLLLWQRPADSGLMPGFWELPEAEHLSGVRSEESAGSFRHTITFHNYLFTVERAQPPRDIGCCQWIEKARLTDHSHAQGVTPDGYHLHRPPAAIALSTIVRKAQKLVSAVRIGVAAGAG